MTAAFNPALDAFIRTIGNGRSWAQIEIRSTESGFILCHSSDRDVSRAELRRITPGEVRRLAMFTASGQFRPLHTSPDLPHGWLLECPNAQDLWRALQDFYPGSIPDWFAVESGAPCVTDYREFSNRQSGMYRITQLLSDSQVADVTRASCQVRFCLKRRLWTVDGLERDAEHVKSAIPCLEPCAILLELARKASRIEQEDKVPVQLSRSELDSLLAAVESAIANTPVTTRVGDIGSAANPRRLQLLIEKFKQKESAAGKSQPGE